MTKTKYYLACDLKNDPELINKYKEHHSPGKVPVEITKSIRDTGVQNMEIYLTGNRLFMIMTVDHSFSFERKSNMDADNPAVQVWENKMNQYQQHLPWAKEGVKWVLMDRIFELDPTD